MQEGSAVGRLIEAAAGGSFPAADGGWDRLWTWAPGIEAVLSFTGHSYVVLDSDRSEEDLAGLPIDGLGGAHHPEVARRLAGPGGWIDSLDVVMVARAHSTGAEPLVERPDLASHPRALYAARLRGGIRPLGYEDAGRRALAVVGRGIGGLSEIGFELEPSRRGSGAAAHLLRAALAALRPGELVVACVAPGNAASLRALLSASFVPVGSVQLFGRAASGGRPTG